MRHFDSDSLRWRLVSLAGPVLLIIVLLCAACVPDPQAAQPASTIPGTFGDVVEEVMPSVVYFLVEVDIEGSGTFMASGSGVIMSEDGYVLTNRHVVEGATSVDATLQDRSTVPVED